MAPPRPPPPPTSLEGLSPVFALGRTLQLFGLILLPAALMYGFESSNPRALSVEIGALAVGGLVFMLGTKLVRSRGGS